jgi:phosphohistidine phosphatase
MRGRLGVKVSEIRHSTKLRAKQTAEAFASKLNVSKITEMEGITPMEEPKKAFDCINEHLKSDADPVLLVGHLPHLNKLASLMIAGNPDADTIEFRMGGVVCLSNEAGKWRVKWIIRPEII